MPCHPEMAACALGQSIHIVHAHDITGPQVLRAIFWHIVPEAVALLHKVAAAARWPYLLFMLGHALKQFEINKGIGYAAVAPFRERAVRPRTHNEVDRFLIKYAVALEPKLVYDLPRECRQLLVGQPRQLESGHCVQPPHPFIDKDILPQDVDFHAAGAWRFYS